MKRRTPSVARDRRGAAAIEFAIIAPVMMLMLMGICDLAYQIYAQSILNGAVQKAGRDSTVQDAASNATAIDAKVAATLGLIIANLSNNCAAGTGNAAVWCATRKNYDTFGAARAEPFTDTNGNGVRDAGECYTDVNANSQWDADPGSVGQGGANDVTVYTVSVTYPRIFPVATLFGWPTVNKITASTMLKNQPYATQVLTPSKQVCT
uniref:TadE/TadG family type IV pilus assembly protein n=1 Tax=uncultured Sphingomonas sp. TaxID=158754 RepID=UPI0035CA1CE5